MPTPRRYPSPAARQAAYRQRWAEARKREQEEKGTSSLPVIATPGHRRWQVLIRQASLLLRQVEGEMQQYYDQRSASWQESERGDTFLESLQALQEAQSAVEDVQR
jgi:hypothetical protein